MSTTVSTEKEIHHYHLFFVFRLRNYNLPVVYHMMSHTSEDALYSDVPLLQSNFETLQETCQNKINFEFYHTLSPEHEADKIRDKLPILKDAIIIDTIENVVEILEKELESNAYDELPTPSIARKCNHLVLNIYANKDIKFNVVDNSDLIRNYIYNTIYRFGRIIYTDGIRTHNGCIKTEYLTKYDEKAKQFFEGYGKNIDRSRPTIPYE